MSVNDLRWAMYYIEDHLNDRIDLEELARTGYVSVMQLYREFHRVTGHTLKDYIRKRRISNACADIKACRSSLTDIAIQNGFESLSAFSKIFKKTVGITPQEYRQRLIFYSFHPDCFPFEETGYPIQVKLEKERRGVGGLYRSSLEGGIEQEALGTLAQAIQQARESGMEWQLFGATPISEPASKGSYELFIQTDQPGFWTSALQEAGFSSIGERMMSGGEAAVLTLPFSNKVGQAWDYVYNQWLAKSGYQPAGGYCWEEFRFRKDGTARDVRLLLPIERKQVNPKVEVMAYPERYVVAASCEGADAEERASRLLFDRITGSGLQASVFYVEVRGSRYCCGVEVQEPMAKIPFIHGLFVRTLPAGAYAALTSRSLGDYAGLEEIMKGWLNGNSQYEAAGEGFALYRVNGSFEVMDMEYCVPVAPHPVKNGPILRFCSTYNRSTTTD